MLHGRYQPTLNIYYGLNNMKNKLLLFGGFLVILYVGKGMVKPKLKYFTASEFGLWYPLMSSSLLEKLDEFRELWGAPVVISSHKDAIGRHANSAETQHNVDKWGEVRAIDVFPQGMNDVNSRRRAYSVAQKVGFTGIGLYTDTAPSNMLHVDVREGGHVATWSRVGGVYLGIGQVT